MKSIDLQRQNGILEIINIRPKETNYVFSLQFNNTTITDTKSIANLFNNHFTSVPKNIEQKIITPIIWKIPVSRPSS